MFGYLIYRGVPCFDTLFWTTTSLRKTVANVFALFSQPSQFRGLTSGVNSLHSAKRPNARYTHTQLYSPSKAAAVKTNKTKKRRQTNRQTLAKRIFIAEHLLTFAEKYQELYTNDMCLERCFSFKCFPYWIHNFVNHRSYGELLS